MSNTKERMDRMQSSYDNMDNPGYYPVDNTKEEELANEIEISIWTQHINDSSFIIKLMERLFYHAKRDELPEEISALIVKVIDDANKPSLTHRPINTIIRYAVRQQAEYEAKLLCEP